MSNAIVALTTSATANVPSPPASPGDVTAASACGFGSVLAEAVEVGRTTAATAAATFGKASPAGTTDVDGHASRIAGLDNTDAAVDAAVDAALDDTASTTLSLTTEIADGARDAAQTPEHALETSPLLVADVSGSQSAFRELGSVAPLASLSGTASAVLAADGAIVSATAGMRMEALVERDTDGAFAEREPTKLHTAAIDDGALHLHPGVGQISAVASAVPSAEPDVGSTFGGPAVVASLMTTPVTPWDGVPFGREVGAVQSGVDAASSGELQKIATLPLQRSEILVPAESGQGAEAATQGMEPSVDTYVVELGREPDIRPASVPGTYADDTSNRSSAALAATSMESRAETGRSSGAALLDLLADSAAGNPADRMAAQVGWMTRNGSQFARLQVHPEELGPIDIAIEQRDGTLAVTLSASHAATRALLEQHVDRMRELLAQDGNTAARFDVTADNSRGQQREAATDDRGSGRGDASRGRGETDDVPVPPPIRLTGHLPSLLDAYA